MRQIQRHQWREAVAPIGDVGQYLRIGDRISIEHLNVRTDRTGIGERQTWFKAELRRGIVQRGNLQRIALLGDDNTCLQISWRAVARELTFDAIGWQARQPQAEDAPMCHGKRTHHTSIP